MDSVKIATAIIQTKGDRTRAADPRRRPRANLKLYTNNMKTNLNLKSAESAAAAVERKNQPARAGTKSSVHRYERRKIREQLRHLDWALAGVD